MAQQSFSLQVQGQTGLTIGSSGTNPTQAELTDYLVDGVRDVACRILAIKPQEASLFSKTSSAINDANGQEVQSGIVLSVVRANGDDANIRNPADLISPNDRFRAKDVNSLHYRSKHNPAYYILDKTVHIIPDPDDNSNKDDAYVTYVDYDTGLVHGDATGAIENFPDKYQGMVVLYASCRSLMNAMAGALSNITAYVSPKITNKLDGSLGVDDDKDITVISNQAWTQLDYDFDDENIDVLKWFQVAGDMIQRQEDIELANTQLEKISTFLAAYQNALANSSARFDKNFQKYSSDYQWMADRHQRLYTEYIGYFDTMRGQQAQQQQAQQARRG